MITLYGVLRSRASRNYWLLQEMGLEFRHVPVIQVYRRADPDPMLHTQSPEFLAVNRNAAIPTLVDGDLALSESLAINLYLAKRYGGALGPADVAEDGLMGMWALWAATGVEPHSLQILYNRAGKPPAERDEALAVSSVATLRAPFAVLNDALAATGFLIGGRFTVADLNTSEIIRYALPAPELFEAAPHVRAWITACHARPAFKAMMTARDQEPA